MHWLISANSKIYDHASSFEHYGYIDWRQGNGKYCIDDIIYIYCALPLKRIRYKCKVKKINMQFQDTRDDKEYWINELEYSKSISGKYFRLELVEQVDTEKLKLEYLLQYGLKAAPQKSKKIYGDLLVYIETNFNFIQNDDFFPESTEHEGLKQQVNVNKYERSSIARAKCVEFNGCDCSICGINFEKKYGKIGKCFIHVHHLKPLHLIGKDYKIDFKKDLIPVCPNCHAMLHKKVNDKLVSIDELKKYLH